MPSNKRMFSEYSGKSSTVSGGRRGSIDSRGGRNNLTNHQRRRGAFGTTHNYALEQQGTRAEEHNHHRGTTTVPSDHSMDLQHGEVRPNPVSPLPKPTFPDKDAISIDSDPERFPANGLGWDQNRATWAKPLEYTGTSVRFPGEDSESSDSERPQQGTEDKRTLEMRTQVPPNGSDTSVSEDNDETKPQLPPNSNRAGTFGSDVSHRAIGVGYATPPPQGSIYNDSMKNKVPYNIQDNIQGIQGIQGTEPTVWQGNRTRHNLYQDHYLTPGRNQASDQRGQIALRELSKNPSYNERWETASVSSNASESSSASEEARRSSIAQAIGDPATPYQEDTEVPSLRAVPVSQGAFRQSEDAKRKPSTGPLESQAKELIPKALNAKDEQESFKQKGGVYDLGTQGSYTYDGTTSTVLDESALVRMKSAPPVANYKSLEESLLEPLELETVLERLELETVLERLALEKAYGEAIGSYSTLLDTIRGNDRTLKTHRKNKEELSKLVHQAESALDAASNRSKQLEDLATQKLKLLRENHWYKALNLVENELDRMHEQDLKHLIQRAKTYQEAIKNLQDNCKLIQSEILSKEPTVPAQGNSRQPTEVAPPLYEPLEVTKKSELEKIPKQEDLEQALSILLTDKLITEKEFFTNKSLKQCFKDYEAYKTQHQAYKVERSKVSCSGNDKTEWHSITPQTLEEIGHADLKTALEKQGLKGEPVYYRMYGSSEQPVLIYLKEPSASWGKENLFKEKAIRWIVSKQPGEYFAYSEKFPNNHYKIEIKGDTVKLIEYKPLQRSPSDLSLSPQGFTKRTYPMTSSDSGNAAKARLQVENGESVWLQSVPSDSGVGEERLAQMKKANAELQNLSVFKNLGERLVAEHIEPELARTDFFLKQIAQIRESSTPEKALVDLFEAIAGTREQQAVHANPASGTNRMDLFCIPSHNHPENIKTIVSKVFFKNGASRYKFTKGIFIPQKNEWLKTELPFTITVEPEADGRIHPKFYKGTASDGSPNPCSLEELTKALSLSDETLAKSLAGSLPRWFTPELERIVQGLTDTLGKEDDIMKAHLDTILSLANTANLIGPNSPTSDYVYINKQSADRIFQPLKNSITVQFDGDLGSRNLPVSGFFNAKNQPGIMMAVDAQPPAFFLRLRNGNYLLTELELFKGKENEPQFVITPTLLVKDEATGIYHAHNAPVKNDTPLNIQGEPLTFAQYLKKNPIDTSYFKEFFAKALCTTLAAPGLSDQLICLNDAKLADLPPILDQTIKGGSLLGQPRLENNCRTIFKELRQTPDGRRLLQGAYPTIDLGHLEKHEALKEEARAVLSLKSGNLLNSLADTSQRSKLKALADAASLTALAGAIAGLGTGIGAALAKGPSDLGELDDLPDDAGDEVDADDLPNNWGNDQRIPEGQYPYLTSCESDLGETFLNDLDHIDIPAEDKQALCQQLNEWLQGFDGDAERNEALKGLLEEANGTGLDGLVKDITDNYLNYASQMITANPSVHFVSDEGYKALVKPVIEGFINDYEPPQQASPQAPTAPSSSGISGTEVGAISGAGLGVAVAGLTGTTAWFRNRKKREADFTKAIEKLKNSDVVKNAPDILKKLDGLKDSKELDQLEQIAIKKVQDHATNYLRPMEMELKRLQAKLQSGPATAPSPTSGT